MLFSAKVLSITALLLSGNGVFAQIPTSWSSTFRPDSLRLEATYNPNNIRITSGSGGKLFTEEASKVPTFRLSDDSDIVPSSQYTIMMVDPDSPTVGGDGEASYLHFLGTNYKLSDPKDASRELVSTANPDFEYEGPKSTDANHRYIILLYTQKNSIEPEVSATSRKEFSVADYEKNSGVGELVAGLYFQTAKGAGGTNASRMRRRATKLSYAKQAA